MIYYPSDSLSYVNILINLCTLVLEFAFQSDLIVSSGFLYFYAPGLKGPPGASSNRIVRPSVCLSVCLSVRPSVCP